MTLRWGTRSAGGVVRAGHGGWTLRIGRPTWLSYMDPETGNGTTVVGWRLLHATRRIRRGPPARP